MRLKRVDPQTDVRVPCPGLRVSLPPPPSPLPPAPSISENRARIPLSPRRPRRAFSRDPAPIVPMGLLKIRSRSSLTNCSRLREQIPKGPQLKIQHQCKKRLAGMKLEAAKRRKRGHEESPAGDDSDPEGGDTGGKCCICWEEEVQVTAREGDLSVLSPV